MSDSLKDLNLTQDELKRFTEAMKKEEFRKLLIDYAEELQDPQNRALYESEITKLENERGMNVKFIHPEPGFCMKTSQTPTNDHDQSKVVVHKKAFINICKNESVDKPTSSRVVPSGLDSKPGMSWSIPHTCTPPREDYDNKKGKCQVYDVVFHPDAYRMGESNARFNQLLIDTALTTIENNFKVKFDKVNVKVLKNLNFKGRPTAATIKRKMTSNEEEVTSKAASADAPNDDDNVDDKIGPLVDQLKNQYYEKQKASVLGTTPTSSTSSPSTKIKTTTDDYTEPEYKILHRGSADIQDCAQQCDDLNGSREVNSMRPKELFISIQLPLCKSSEHVNLDIFEKSLLLESRNPNYKLDLKLPYPISENESKAKFDKSKRCLNLTLHVIPFVAHVDVSNGSNVEMIEDAELNNSFVPSSSSSSSSVCSNSCHSLSPSPTKSIDSPLSDIPETVCIATPPAATPQVKLKLPQQLSISEFKNKLVISLNITNYDKSSIRLHIDAESSLSVTCESLSSSGSYIQYHAAHVFFYYVKSLERQRDPLSIYDGDLNAYNCVEKLSNFEIKPLSVDSFQIKLNRMRDDQAGDNKGEIKKAFISLGPCRLSQIEDLIIAPKNDHEFMIVDVDQRDILNECVNEAQTANSMSKKEFMLNFNAISSSSHLDEDDDHDDEEKDVKDSKQQSISQTKKEPENDLEKTYLNNQNEHHHHHEDQDAQKASLSNSSISTSLNSESFSSSSLNNSLKGILKKPRSCSESESTSTFYNNDFRRPNNNNSNNNNNKTSQLSSDADDVDSNIHGSKKSVSFNKQVVRNVFKANSTVCGMKKPNSNKNKKKNQRNRTVSDPSHDSNNNKDDNNNNNNAFAAHRRISESSDDGSCLMTTSNDSLTDSDKAKRQPQQQQQQAQATAAATNSKNKKKKKQQKKKQQLDKEEEEEVEDKTFDMQTMLEWKNQGLLPVDDVKHATSSAVKLKNSIINDLDD
jgi:dynein assembly factor 2